MRHHTLSQLLPAGLGVAIFVTAATLANAQDPMSGDQRRVPREFVGAGTPGVSIFAQSCGLWTDGEAIAGGGPDYAVRFDRSGITFTPALGRGTPINRPLHLALESIHRGAGTGVELARDALPSCERDRVDYARADGIVERYEVRPEGVEQSFWFGRSVPGRGDLVVRMRVSTELSAAAADTTPAGVAWSNGHAGGGVRIGAVTGVDSAGRRARGSLSLDGETLDLVLPASFVDSATYPLVLDPLIGTSFVVGDTTGNERRPDVAYDATNDVYLVVWERGMSGSEIQIRGQRVGSDGVLVGGMIPIRTGVVATKPKVASVGARGRFVVVWQHGMSLFGPWAIAGCTVMAADAAVTSPVWLAPASFGPFDPDVGGSAAPNSDAALVVWAATGGIRLMRFIVRQDGTLSLNGPFVVASGSDMADPTVSESGGAPGRYVVAWEWGSAQGTNIMATAVSHNGLVLGTALPLGSFTREQTNPDVDGDGTDFLVVFERLESSGPKHDIMCRKVRYSEAAGGLIAASAVRALESDPNDDEIDPAVAFVGTKYLVAWIDENAFLDYTVAVMPLAPNCDPCGVGASIAMPFTLNRGPAFATQLSGSASGGGDQAMLVCASTNRQALYRSQVVAQRIEALGGGTVTTLGPGCGNGGRAGTNGPLAIGNSGFEFVLTNADRRATVGSFNVNIIGPPFQCGTCQVTPALIPLPSTVSGGTARVAVPVPCDINLVGGTLEGQWASGPTLVSPCSLVSNVSFSTRLGVMIGL